MQSLIAPAALDTECRRGHSVAEVKASGRGGAAWGLEGGGHARATQLPTQPGPAKMCVDTTPTPTTTQPLPSASVGSIE